MPEHSPGCERTKRGWVYTVRGVKTELKLLVMGCLAAALKTSRNVKIPVANSDFFS